MASIECGLYKILPDEEGYITELWINEDAKSVFKFFREYFKDCFSKDCDGNCDPITVKTTYEEISAWITAFYIENPDEVENNKEDFTEIMNLYKNGIINEDDEIKFTAWF